MVTHWRRNTYTSPATYLFIYFLQDCMIYVVAQCVNIDLWISLFSVFLFFLFFFLVHFLGEADMLKWKRSRFMTTYRTGWIDSYCKQSFVQDHPTSFRRDQNSLAYILRISDGWIFSRIITSTLIWPIASHPTICSLSSIDCVRRVHQSIQHFSDFLSS